jgi:hypothetical protein
MHAKDVKIGGRYKAKVSNVATTIQIVSKSPSGGWVAENEATGRRIRVKTAQRLRSVVTEPAPTTRGVKGEYMQLINNPTRPIRAKRQPNEPAHEITVVETRERTATRTRKGQEALSKVTAHFLNEKKGGLTLADAIDQAIMYLGDFIYNGAESGMQDEVDQVIGRLSEFLHSGETGQ